MNIAVFSDVRSHLRMLLHMIRNWQIAHSAHLDAALIAGDLRCTPDPSSAGQDRRSTGVPDKPRGPQSKRVPLRNPARQLENPR